MADGRTLVDGVSTPSVVALTGVPAATLDYWIRTGLVAPSLVPSQGRRSTRWWSVPDVVVVKAVKALREAGCPLQKVRDAKRVLGQGAEEGVVLYWDGADVLAVEPWGDVYSAIKHPGQQVLHLLALPIHRWQADVAKEVVAIDLAAIRARRQSRQRLRSQVKPIEVRRSRAKQSEGELA